uniref:Uncharacterized protein n=1 Tax=viral metagenome TaxID=1070528 RepID=A0A6M3JX77_9ZZZZ
MSVNYEFLASCEFEDNSLFGEGSCSEPAIAWLWFDDNHTDGFHVCERHLDVYLDKEDDSDDVEDDDEFEE